MAAAPRDELLAKLVVRGGDFPWLNAEVRPAAGFAEVRPLFDDELRLLEVLDEDPESWEAAYRRIRAAVRLVAPDGLPVPEFLLHIEGAEVSAFGVRVSAVCRSCRGGCPGSCSRTSGRTPAPGRRRCGKPTAVRGTRSS